MGNVKIELRREEIRGLLRSDGVAQLCSQYAENAVSRLGDGYEASTYTGKNRVNASVMAVTYEAKKENMETNSILKAIK